MNFWKKNNITLILTIYKQEIDELTFWINSYIKYGNKFEFVFLIDNPEYKHLKYLRSIIRSDDIFVNKKNVGKFMSIYSFLKLNNQRTSHVKICDPDDFISFSLFKKISKLDDNTIYIMNRSTVSNGYKDFNEKSIKKTIANKSTKPDFSFANHITILPVKNIKTDDKYVDNYRINYSDDKLLGNIAFVNKAKVQFIDKSFYLYVANNGNSNLNNSDKYLPGIVDTLNAILKLYSDTKLLPPENFDSLWKWLQRFNGDENTVNLKKIKLTIDKFISLQNKSE